MKIVPDTSILIHGIISDLIKKGELKNVEIVLPEFVVEELRAQASRGREIGFLGLEEIKKLRKLAKIRKIGRRQTLEEIQLAKYGRIDALIIDTARNENAILYTADRVQALVAEAEGIKVKYFEPYEKKKRLKIEEFFTEDTMSVHLKENAPPLAKRGKPGAFKLVKIREAPLTKEELEKIIAEIMEVARYEEDVFIELGGYQATVIQMNDMRIAIARPPFSDGIEITVVRPIAKISLEDYRLAEVLKERLIDRTRAILIAGPPGSGKSTFAAALAEFYKEKGFVVKTMESPRDLQVSEEITQYTKLKNSFANTADILLLVRPDYTIFDEVRKTEDFEVFADMRLAGIGMVGVVHATEAIDAIQRFISRVELGLIPHIVDTVIFIEKGEIKKVYVLKLVVRVPTGMTEEDLARPIVEVRDLETDELEYEIYTYGEENVIIPVKEEQKRLEKLKSRILKEIEKFDRNALASVEGNKVFVYVENKAIPKILGKKGRNVKALEKKLGVAIEILPKIDTFGKEVSYKVAETGGYFVFRFSKKLKGKLVNFYDEQKFIASANVGKKGVRIAKNSEVGKKILEALTKKTLRVFVV